MKRALPFAVAMVLLTVLCACGGSPAPAAEPEPHAAPASLHAADASCSETEILVVRDTARSVAGLEDAAKYLVVHHGDIPFPERGCIETILDGSDFFALDGAEYTDNIDPRYADVIMGVLYLHDTEIDPAWRLDAPQRNRPQENSTAPQPGGEAQAAALITVSAAPGFSQNELAAMLEANEQYRIDATVYPHPEDAAFLALYEFSTPSRVYADVMGVTVTAPEHIHANFTRERVTVEKVLKNTSDTRVYFHGIDSQYDWDSFPGYDPGTKMYATNVVGTPTNQRPYLEPGETRVLRLDIIDIEAETHEGANKFNMYHAFEFYRLDETGQIAERTEATFVIPITLYCGKEYGIEQARLSGVAVDAETGERLSHVQISYRLSGCDSVRMETDENGEFAADVSVYQSPESGDWARGFLLANDWYGSGHGNAQDSGYGSFNLPVIFEAGEAPFVTVALPKAAAPWQYQLTGSCDIHVQAYHYESSMDGEIFATVPYHADLTEAQTKNETFLHVFDIDGNLKFRYPMGHQNPAVDVSKDGSLVAAVPLENGRSVPTVWTADGKIVYRYDGVILVQDETSGAPAPSDAPPISLGLQISDDNRYFACEFDGYLVMVDLASKTVIWDDYQPGTIRMIRFSPDGQMLYASRGDGYLTAYDALSGKPIWKTYTESFAFDMKLTDKYVLTSSKAEYGGGYFLCLDRLTGRTKWSIPMGARCCWIVPSPDEALVFWGNDLGTGGYMIDIESGRVLWSWDGGSAARWSADGQYILVKGYIFTRSGQVVWKQEQLHHNGADALNWMVCANDDLSKIAEAYDCTNADRRTQYGQVYFFTRE